MRRLRAFLNGIAAGAVIAIGGTVFLSLESRVLGALFFAVGLFAICTFDLSLFTGRVCYVLDRDKNYALDLPFIWLGNIAGTALVAFLESLTRIGSALKENAARLCEAKLSDGVFSILILAILCNILIFIAVDGFKNNPHAVGKYLSIFFGVTVFILCGFEHCVANMYYITVAGAWSLKAVGYILVMTLGNAIGGVIIPLLKRFNSKTEDRV